MLYKVEYDGNITDVLEATEKCGKMTVELANIIMAKASIDGVTDIKELKKWVVELIKVSKDCGSLEVIKGIVDGTFGDIVKGGDANE